MTPPNDKAMKELVFNASLLRQNFLQQLIDGPNRDMNAECGYPEEVTAELCKAMYDREGLAKRVVHCLPEESWAESPEVYETEDPEETDFEKTLKEVADSQNIWHFLHRADALSGIGRFGILLLGLSDGKAMSEPVEGLSETGESTSPPEGLKLLYLRAFDETAVTVDVRESNPNNPRFGRPTMYTINFSDGTLQGTGEVISQKVHWTRVIHIADNRTTSEIFGEPRMKPVYNRLHDLRKVISGSGEMFWKGAFPGYSFEVNPDAADGVIDTAGLRSEFENWSNGLQRYLALTGVSAKALSPQVSDPRGHVEVHLQAIATSMSIPFRVLFGSEQAQLASSQDAKNWAKRVGRRQKEYLTPMIVRPFIDRLIAFGILPEVEEYKVDWPDLAALSDQEKAQVAVTKTDALAKYIGGGVDQLIPPAIFLQQVLGFTVAETESIMEEAEDYAAEKEAEQAEQAEEQAAQQAEEGLQQAQDANQKPPKGQQAPSKNGKPVGASTGGSKPPFDPTANFDPDQERDENGRWTSGGGGGEGSAAEKGPSYPPPPKGISKEAEELFRARGRLLQKSYDKKLTEEQRNEVKAKLAEATAKLEQAKIDHPEWFKKDPGRVPDPKPKPEPEKPEPEKPDPKPEPKPKVGDKPDADKITKMATDHMDTVVRPLQWAKDKAEQERVAAARDCSRKYEELQDRAAEIARERNGNNEPTWDQIHEAKSDPRLESHVKAYEDATLIRKEKWEAVDKADKAFEAAMEQGNKEIIKAMAPQSPFRPDTHCVLKSAGASERTKAFKEAREGMDFLSTCMEDGVWGNDTRVAIRTDVKMEKGQRSYCSWDGSRIEIQRGHYGVDVTTVHEIGHAIEDRTPAIRRACQDFLKARTAGEPLQRLRDVTHDKGYGADEMCRPDRFYKPYVGKEYDSGHTEVLSMGIQRFRSDPVRFAAQDPEHFKLTVRIMRGEIK